MNQNVNEIRDALLLFIVYLSKVVNKIEVSSHRGKNQASTITITVCDNNHLVNRKSHNFMFLFNQSFLWSAEWILFCIHSMSLTPLRFDWVKKVSRCKNQKNAATALWFMKNIWHSQCAAWELKIETIVMLFAFIPSLWTLKCQFAAINTSTIFSKSKTGKKSSRDFSLFFWKQHRGTHVYCMTLRIRKHSSLGQISRSILRMNAN